MQPPYKARFPSSFGPPSLVYLLVISSVALVVACAPAQPSPAPSKPAPVASPAAKAAPSKGEGAPAKGPLEVVRRGNLRGITFQSAIAKARGYYAEAGIDEQETTFGSGAEMGQAMAAGQLEVIATSNTAAFFNALARGIRQPFVMDNWHLEKGHPSNVIVVRPDLANVIKQPTDLRGRKVLVSTPLRDGGEWFSLKKVFDQAGLRFEDVEFERLTYPDMLPAMANKNADAASVIEPFVTLGKNQGIYQPWLTTSDFDAGAQIAGMAFSESFRRDRSDVARRWTVASVRGARDFNDFLKGKNREVIGPILAAHTGLPPDVVAQVAFGPVHPDGRVNVEYLVQAQQQLLEWGTIQQTVPADQIVDLQFLEYALQQLGPYGG